MSKFFIFYKMTKKDKLLLLFYWHQLGNVSQYVPHEGSDLAFPQLSSMIELQSPAKNVQN